MKFAQLLFSPTGGTKKVAEAITGAWEAEVDEYLVSYRRRPHYAP